MSGAMYSQTWLAKYGQGLKREEIRLVQAYRGLSLSPQLQEDLLTFASWLVLDRDATTAAARIAREADAHQWKCDAPAVTKLGGAR